MPFGLINALLIYKRVVNKTFCNFIGHFMKLFLDDFSIYCNMATDLAKLQLSFKKYKEYGINLNVDKYLILIYLKIILGHILFKEDKFFNPKIIKDIAKYHNQKKQGIYKSLISLFNFINFILSFMYIL